MEEQQTEGTRRVPIKLDEETARWFRDRAQSKGMTQIGYLRHLLQQDERSTSEVLVSYNAVIHAPVRFRGTIERYEPPAEEQPTASEEDGGT